MNKDDGGAYHRVAGYKGENLRITLPQGDYTGKAVMLAGRGSDKTLLAGERGGAREYKSHALRVRLVAPYRELSAVAGTCFHGETPV